MLFILYAMENSIIYENRNKKNLPLNHSRLNNPIKSARSSSSSKNIEIKNKKKKIRSIKFEYFFYFMHLWDDEKENEEIKSKRWRRIECKVEYLFQAMLSHGVPLNSKHIKFHGLLSPLHCMLFFFVCIFFC